MLEPFPTIWVDGSRVYTIDQTRLPFHYEVIELATWRDCEVAIRSMQVRGAPLIGVVAAFGVALGLREYKSTNDIEQKFAEICSVLTAARPTAVNLAWAIGEMQEHLNQPPHRQLPGGWPIAAWMKANSILEADVLCNRAIAQHGVQAWETWIARARSEQRPLQILTHCNAGALATVAWGTALAPVYLAHQQGVAVHVWVDETRPRNQGASLTAWELARAGVPHTVIVDNAGGLMMMHGEVDLVIVGCDRVAANGDVVNKIGTYLKALAARAHQVPFWVACPASTMDKAAANGAAVVIEERDSSEVQQMQGWLTDAGSPAHGRITNVQVLPLGTKVRNPGFDITPAALVTGLITEYGVVDASPEGVQHVLERVHQ